MGRLPAPRTVNGGGRSKRRDRESKEMGGLQWGAAGAGGVVRDGAGLGGERVTPGLRGATGGVRYPPPHAGAVQSVTMRLLLEGLAEEGDQGLRLEEESFTLGEVLAGQELVVVGSGGGGGGGGESARHSVVPRGRRRRQVAGGGGREAGRKAVRGG